MDPFESDLLCSSNVSNGKNASSKDEASLIDQDRWQRFAVWQYSQYLQRDRNLAERWADMNKLDTKMRRSLKRRRLAQPSAPPHTAAHPCPEADAPKHVRLGQKPLDAKPSTPEIEAKSYQRHRRLLGRNMPLVSPIDQADLSRSGPDPEVAHNSTRSPVTVPKSTNRPLSSSSKLFQPHESSGSSGDEEQQISALRSHLSMKARHVMHSKTVTGPSRDAGSGGKAVNLGTRSSRREKLIKPIPMPSGRTLVVLNVRVCSPHLLMLGPLTVSEVSRYCGIHRLLAKEQDRIIHGIPSTSKHSADKEKSRRQGRRRDQRDGGGTLRSRCNGALRRCQNPYSGTHPISYGSGQWAHPSPKSS